MAKQWIIYTEKNGVLGTIPKSIAKNSQEAISMWSNEYLEAKLLDESQIKKTPVKEKTRFH